MKRKTIMGQHCAAPRPTRTAALLLGLALSVPAGAVFWLFGLF